MNKKKIHKFSAKEDRIIKRYISNNVGNISEGIREAALELQLSKKSINNHYYRVIRPKLSNTTSLKKLIFNQGFFILSKNKIFINGKNSANSKIKDRWVKEETVNKLIKNL